MSTTPPPADRAIIAAYRTHTGATQIQIVQLDADDCGFGHRLAGPKHGNMGTTTLVERTLDADDAREIRSVLNAAFPPPPTDVTVYEVRVGIVGDDHPETVAVYATPTAAEQDAEAAYQDRFGKADSLMWLPALDAPGLRATVLCATAPDVTETETDWHIVQVTVPAAYTPAGGEQA